MFDYDREQVKKDEGFRRHVYQCTEGKNTIGYGFNLDAGISEELASVILDEQLHAVATSLRQNISSFDGFPDEVKNVLCNMGFQLGVSGLLKFKRTIAALELGMYEDAAKEMLDSKWARQTPNRAKRLSDRIGALA